MELAELENILKVYDKKISEKIRLNRDILKRLLLNKPQEHLRKERLKVIYQLFSPLLLLCITTILMEVIPLRFSFTFGFYTGLGLFLPVYVFIWSLNIKHYKLIRKINFHLPVVSLRKRVSELEKYNLWITNMRNILMPLLISGILLLFIPSNGYDMEFVLLLILIAAVFIVSAFYRNYAVRERYHALKREIEELAMLEKQV